MQVADRGVRALVKVLDSNNVVTFLNLADNQVQNVIIKRTHSVVLQIGICFTKIAASCVSSSQLNGGTQCSMNLCSLRLFAVMHGVCLK